VQPTPRWHLSASTIVLHVDHHTLLRNAIFRVKDVPLMYLPVFYYPTEEDDRSTGFLIPGYGTSNSRGHTISNEFFWAIDRSQDATLSHEWYSKLGQRVEGEYRYNFGAGSEGVFRSSTLGQDEVPATSTPASRSYEVRANAQQLLPLGLRARARVDYYSSFTTMQTFNTNVYDASRTSRTVGANVVGAWNSYSMNSTFDRSEYFTDATHSVLTGNAPRISISRNERPITRGSQLYFSVNGEYADFVRESRAGDDVLDSSLGRVDFLPQVRFPFKRWQWFTVNSTASWRQTMYSRSYSEDIDPVTERRRIVQDNLSRQYFTVGAQTVGPVFTRIWNTPDNGYAERFKHSIEPFFNVQRTSSIDVFDRIVQTDGVDNIVGNATNLTYGLNNRLYAKRRIGQTSQAQEIVSLEIFQSYYSDARSAQYDANYNTGAGSGSAPSNYSPISLRMRTTPTPTFNTTFRAELDSTEYALRTLSVDGSYNWTNRLQSSAGWSRRFFIEGVAGFDNPEGLDHSLNLAVNAHTQDNRIGTIYTMNLDVLRSRIYQQRVSGFYNTQCCGVAFEYQRYDYGGGYAYPVDKRFFMTFTLAGLGNFSPFTGPNSGNAR
jgi:LPS-assembly protein